MYFVIREISNKTSVMWIQAQVKIPAGRTSAPTENLPEPVLNPVPSEADWGSWVSQLMRHGWLLWLLLPALKNQGDCQESQGFHSKKQHSLEGERGGRQPCQGLNADPGAGAQRALGTKKGRGESRKFSFSYHPQRRVSSHYVKMQKDDRRIAEEADLPAFLQPSMRRKKTALNERAARERLRRCILSKAWTPGKAELNPTILFHPSEFRILCPSSFQSCPCQKTAFLCVLAACYL